MITRLALVAVALLLGGCGGRDTQPPPTPARLVKVVRVGEGDALQIDGYPATIRSTRRADLSFAAGGRAAVVLVKAGDSVAAGQALVWIDPRPAVLRVRQARAELERADAAAADAIRERRTQLELAAGDATSRRSAEKAETGVREAAAGRKAAAAVFAQALYDRDRTVLRAPFAGRIASRGVEPGQEIAAAATVLQIDGDGAREAVALVPAPRAARLRAGQEVTVVSADSTDLPAHVTGTGSRVVAGTAVEVVVRLDRASGLAPGMSASLSLPDTASEGIRPVIPFEALRLAADASASVLVLEKAGDGTARVRSRRVRLARVPRPGQRVAVLAGLARGEQVVAAGVAFLQDGEAVRVLPPLPR